MILTKNGMETSPQSYPDRNTKLWNDPNRMSIPDWIKEYMDYHSDVVHNLTRHNWKNHKYLILQCYRTNERCGGLSDRLKPIPLILLAAQRSNRILFVDWDRPLELPHFLIPPPNGFQWIVPDFLIPMIRSSSTSAAAASESTLIISRASQILSAANSSDALQIHTHLQDYRGGESQYDEELGDGAFQAVYHELFRIFFEPSPEIQALMDRHLVRESTSSSSSGAGGASTLPPLVEGQYNVAHYRAEYGKEVNRYPILSDPTFLKYVTINAIRCASELQPLLSVSTMDGKNDIPIYFASDHPWAVATARQLARHVQYPIITFLRTEDTPRHLDDYGQEIPHGDSSNETTMATTSTSNPQPSDYYSTFVDLFLAGSGRCVTYGRGGFGRLAALLSFNTTCQSKHVKGFFPNKCKGRPPFRDLFPSTTNQSTTIEKVDDTLPFLF